jgi:hypothetical protein
MRQLVRLDEQEALSVRRMVVEDMILDLVGQHELQLAVGALVDSVLISHEVRQRLRSRFGQGPSSPHEVSGCPVDRTNGPGGCRPVGSMIES